MSQTANTLEAGGHSKGVAALRYLRIAFRLALASLGLLALAAVAYFVYEWAYPPDEPFHSAGAPFFFGAEDPRRAPYILTASIRYAAYILYVAALLKTAGVLVCIWIDQRYGWKLAGAGGVFFIANFLRLVDYLPCGCA